MEIEDFKGQIIVQISSDDNGVDFTVFNGEEYHYYSLTSEDGPPNDCQVWLESVIGDLKDLLGEPLLMSEMATNKGKVRTSYSEDEYGTWTFYKFATRKGYVDLRFCGTLNGYYCEQAVLVDLGKAEKEYVEEQINKNKNKFKL